MAQPSELPEWADGGSAVITEPLSGKKQLGFTQGERPPGQYLNWLFNLIYLWLTWLKAGGHTLLESGSSDWVMAPSNTSSAYSDANSPGGVQLESTDAARCYLDFIPVGERIQDIYINWFGTGSPTTGAFELKLQQLDLATGALTTVFSTGSTVTIQAGTGFQTSRVANTIALQLLTGCSYWIECAGADGSHGGTFPAGELYLVGVTVTHDVA